MRLRNIFSRRRHGKSNSVDSRAATVHVDRPVHVDHPVPEYNFVLPDDIIYELFENAALVYPPGENATMPAPTGALRRKYSRLGWTVLIHVCRRWRSIGLSATLAPLWARIVCLYCKPSVALERAQGCPLYIDMTWHYGQSSYDRSMAFEELVRLNIDNAGVLIAPSKALLTHLDEHRRVLPVLRELRFERRTNELPMPLWEAPGLRTATLRNTLLPPSTSESLCELHLRIDANHIPLHILRDFLRACRSLQIFNVDVKGTWPLSDSDYGLGEVRWKRQEPICLAHLKRAKITVGEDYMVADLYGPIVSSHDVALDMTITPQRPKQTFYPRPHVLFAACASAIDCMLYDTIEMGMADIFTGPSSLYLHLSSSCTLSSCEFLFPTNENTRDVVLSSLPSYMPSAAAQIRYFTLDALIVDAGHIDEPLGVLGRALTGVTDLKLANMDYWSTTALLRALRQIEPIPVLSALRTVGISDLHISELHELYEASEWWNEITSALAARKRAGLEPLKYLRLDGELAGTSVWEEGINIQGTVE